VVAKSIRHPPILPIFDLCCKKLKACIKQVHAPVAFRAAEAIATIINKQALIGSQNMGCLVNLGVAKSIPTVCQLSA